jgi:serine/threonine-protein kinase
MALTAGTRVGDYEIITALGAGGMGEVYRARDPKLQRDVAIKVLPASFALDPDRLARFQREAQVLASLNHPNIAHVHGLEQSGGLNALVMELVEGEDLLQRISRGPIPLDDALPLARQIAEALEAAHEQGIIHRDLKPANIKVRPDGAVKVLDFGLAKAMEPAFAQGASAGQAGVSISPTITTPAMTKAGTILGTAAYMSPEQARGKAVDRRADIWAFGCVVYEMLTGGRAFDGDGVSDTLARVIEREPEWTRLPPALSPTLRAYLKRCLHKDPKQRVQAIGDVRLALEGGFETVVPQTAAPAVVTRWRPVVLASAAALIAGGAIIGTLVWVAMRHADLVPPVVSRLHVSLIGTATLTINGNDRDLAITPDGSRIVYVGNNGTQLFVRELGALEPVAVFTGAPRGPFVSPDGQWIGFWEDLALMRVEITGGPAITVARLEGNGPRGATWGPDETIVAATYGGTTGLRRVAVAGGTTMVLTRPDRAQGEVDHLWPEMLPGGRAVLFTITSVSGGLAAAQVAVLDLQTGVRRVLVRGGSHAHYVANGLGSPKHGERDSGHLVYAAAGVLRAVPFDLTRLEVRGAPVPVVPDVVTTPFGSVDAVVAGNGTLAYVPGGGGVARAERTLVWVDRQGRETAIVAPSHAYAFPRLAPDGTRVAVYSQDQELDLWIWDLARARLTRATFDSALDAFPVWTPDSRRLVFSSARSGTRNLFWQAADGTGGAERLTQSPNQQDPTAVSPDGRRLIFTEVNPKTGNDVMQMMLDESRQVTPLVSSTFNEKNGIISPDGRWLAYEANVSGRFEIWVRPFPDVTSGQWQVTTAGGTRPLWARSGKELFYVAQTGALMRVGVEPGPSWAATPPSLLVKEGYFTIQGGFPARSFDVAPDGQRFLMIKQSGDASIAPPNIIVVQHWVEELKRLVPAAK